MMSSDVIDVFRQEAAELVDQLEAALLSLGDGHDPEHVNGAFRALHTLKGSGSMFGFTALASFVHDFETAFDRVRKGETEPDQALVRVALASVDLIRGLIADPAVEAHGGDALLEELRAATAGGLADEGGNGAIAGAEEAPEATTMPCWQIRFKLPPDALVNGTNPAALLDELRALGTCSVTVLVDDIPALQDIDPRRTYLGWDVRLTGDVSYEQITDVFLFLKDEMEMSIELGDGASGAPVAAAAAAPPEVTRQAPRPLRTSDGSADGSDSVAARPGAEKAASSLRVPAERLDALMDRVGELVIAQSRLSQIALASADANLVSVAEEIERLTSSLRETTMSTRMVPIGSLFGRFRRLAHDLSDSLDKPFELITSGEETELDKTMIEQLADPLVHLIRNAADHGLEQAADRHASGKADVGQLRLSASYRGAEVAIAISDDGRGLDVDRIRARAVEAGLISETATLSDAEIHRLIFEPGFSTAATVTSLSGRGVGMDVVKRAIDALRGSIDIESRAGEGTRITLRLPLTLAIIDGLLVRVGSERYTIPLAAVEECLELPRVLSADGRDRDRGSSFLNIRGSLVPYLKLRELFGAEEPADAFQKVVVVTSGDVRVGVVVDQIIGNNQTVIKQLSRLHSGVKTFSGATILGDGSVALILDVMNLVGFGQSMEESQRGQLGRAA